MGPHRNQDFSQYSTRCFNGKDVLLAEKDVIAHNVKAWKEPLQF